MQNAKIKNQNDKEKCKNNLLSFNCECGGKGFSLVEVLIVMGIFVILAAAAMPIYANLQVSSQLNETSAQIVQTLRLAREYSRSGFRDSVYGVYFESNQPLAADRFVLYKGGSFAGREDSFDQAIVIPKTITLSGSLSGNEINFSQGLGTPSGSGEVGLINENNQEKTVRVNSLGFVDIE